MRTRALGDLRDDIYKRADRENAKDRFTPAEVNEYANQSIAALRDMLIQARGQDFYSKTSPAIVIVQGTTIYALPSDAVSILSLRIDNGGGSQYMLEPFSDLEEARMRLISSSTSGALVRYRLLAGESVELLPQPTPGSSVYVRYIPNAPRLIADSDLLEGFNGWEDFVILDAARKIATKDQNWQLVASLKADIADITNRIKSLATRRDRGRPEQVQDVRAERQFNRFQRRRWGGGFG